MNDKSMYTRYASNTIVRGMVSLIPYFGPFIDISLSNKAANIHNERVLEFLGILKDKLNKGEMLLVNEEEQYDLFIKTMEGAVKTRSSQKKEYYAELLTKGLTLKDSNKDCKIELMINILNHCTEVHLKILIFAFNEFKKENNNVKHKSFQIFIDDGSDIPALEKEKSKELVNIYDMAILTLLSQGLLELGKNPKMRPYGEYKISAIGKEFMTWISS